MQLIFKQWLSGIRADFWLPKEKLIGEFIAKNKIPALEKISNAVLEEHTRDLAGVLKPVGAKITIDKIKHWPGGLKNPHLHYKGDLYVLNDAQWKKFTTPLLEELSTKLTTGPSISFDGLVDAHAIK
ncbi:hypothetical protein [Chlorobium sp. KB01]|uniref:hypothetical protein n=1 Tax=Chlorobium sp. KB01 TaxID=1917528 RepID=UPI00097800DC|nr:hypothetical protein [Chlorobium sp. KB01]